MTYVMSDIHGNMRRFNSVMEQINLQPEDTLYILGDVIDRHPDGIRILRRIMDKPNIKMLLGNHEYMMLRPSAVLLILMRKWTTCSLKINLSYGIRMADM